MNIQVLFFVLVIAQVNCDCSMKNPCSPLKGLQFNKFNNYRVEFISYRCRGKSKSDFFLLLKIFFIKKKNQVFFGH